jgi:hypothetical protein
MGPDRVNAHGPGWGSPATLLLVTDFPSGLNAEPLRELPHIAAADSVELTIRTEELHGAPEEPFSGRDPAVSHLPCPLLGHEMVSREQRWATS